MIKIFKKAFCFCAFLCMFLPSEAQNITGTWQGTLDVQGNKIPLVFHIKKDSSDKWIGSFDSPSQHAFNLSCSEVITKEDSVILVMAIINGKYAGLVSADKTQITGTWFQGPGSLPLVVKKTSDTAVVKEQKRPQTPKPPFPYQSDEVVYTNADQSIQFGGTLTYPSADAKSSAGIKTYPAVILITGSGQQDRDETLFGHKPFAVIADYLTKKGFVVLRVDDRGIGKTTGNFSEVHYAGLCKGRRSRSGFP